MASTKEYKDYVLGKFDFLDNIICKKMMGEYLLYCNGTLFGGIYDNRFLIKITKSNKKYNLMQQIPYPNAKPMFLLDDIDDIEKLRTIIDETCCDLSKIRNC